MIRRRFDSLLPAIYSRLAAMGLGLMLAGAGGCAAGGLAGIAAQAVAPVALSGAQIASTAHGGPPITQDTNKDEAGLKCQQVQNTPPAVEEIREALDGSIESREIRLSGSGGTPKWVVFRSRGSSPDGWHRQTALEKLHFNPPLTEVVTDGKPQFLAYTLNVPETQEQSEEMMSIADEFGAHAGNFEWNGKSYGFAITETLPCFPGPEN